MIETSTVKSCLESWREVVLHVDSLLGWDKDWYPAVTAGLLTFKFLFVWYWDPTLLTFLAMTGIMLTLVDYLGPKIMNQVFKPDAWTGVKEKQFEEVCEGIVGGLRCVEDAHRFCREAKEKKPILHFLGTIFTLFSVAWIGNKLNNFFLLYLVTLTLLMLPGLHRKGLLKKYFSQITLKISEVVKGKESMKKVE